MNKIESHAQFTHHFKIHVNRTMDYLDSTKGKTTLAIIVWIQYHHDDRPFNPTVFQAVLEEAKI